MNQAQYSEGKIAGDQLWARWRKGAAEMHWIAANSPWQAGIEASILLPCTM